ncbi:MAG: L,D-transpeptidase [Rhizobiales bacterium]|nr:L,D-transpeptidase [Hyphomicrobiales bacterium]
MRNLAWALALLCVNLIATPASGAKLKSSPQAFQIFGGMGGGQTKSAFSFGLPSLDALLHKTVSLSTGYQPGTVIVRTGERKLYYVLSGREAVEYHVGVGRDGFTWSGTNRVSHKAEWPDWRPPREMIEREAAGGRKIPEFMPGGPDNPLGARAIYIGDTEFRIHGTTEPWSIGLAVSSGCIRMMNEEVIDLYNRVVIGALVVVEN